MNKRVAVHVLGCKVNQYEVEAIKEIFKNRGYQIVDFDDQADVYIVHTCTVTHLSDRKSRQFIRKAIKKNPDAIVAATGCYAQVSPEEIEKIQGVDVVLGTKDRYKIVDMVEKAHKDKQIKLVTDSKANREFEELPVVKPSRARAFLKIQEGCDRFCTYCIVPYARGPVKSRAFKNTIDEVKNLINEGYQEIVLTGVHTGTYGKDLLHNENLFTLVEEIVKINGLKRLRISSLDPDDISEELLKLMTENDLICPHYHIPLQSGDDHILKKMGRRYNLNDYRELTNKIRDKRPDAAITTDVIVGFPGEDENNFENTMNFIKEISFADLHVFKYSPRKGTPAAEYPGQVASHIKTQRSNLLIALANELWQEYAQLFLGKIKEVLVETKSQGYWEGHTDNYLKVKFIDEGKEDLTGSIIPVYLEKIGEEKFITGLRR